MTESEIQAFHRKADADFVRRAEAILKSAWLKPPSPHDEPSAIKVEPKK